MKKWLSAVGLATCLVAPATAFGANTLAVDDDGQALPGNCNALTPASPTITGAVTAALPGDTIVVCPGVYVESVVVNKTLTLKGPKAGVAGPGRSLANEAVVTGDGTATEPFALQTAANGVVIDGFQVKGVDFGPGIYMQGGFSAVQVLDNVVTNNVFGIYANSAPGGQTLIKRNLVQDNNVGFGTLAASGNGIYSDQGAQDMLIGTNTINRQQNGAILFASGLPVDDIIVQNNKATDNANFVNLFGGTNYTIRHNTIRDTNTADDPQQGSGIRVAQDTNGVVVSGNTIVNAAFDGIAVRDTADNVDITGNTITNPANDGISVTDPSDHAVTARRNKVRSAGLDGIFLDNTTMGNNLLRNNVRGSGDFDCNDDSTGGGTAGTANFWQNNSGVTSDPPGLCSP